jgi:hypothetical protein
MKAEKLNLTNGISQKAAIALAKGEVSMWGGRGSTRAVDNRLTGRFALPKNLNLYELY